MKAIILFSLMLFPLLSLSQPTIYALKLDGLHQKDNQGAYDLIIKEAMASKKSYTVEVQVPAYAEKLFKKCTNCCISPANKSPEFYDYGDQAVETSAMNVAKIYIYTAQGSATINNLADLKGKKVGVRHGLPYGKSYDNAGLNSKAVDKIEKNIKKIDHGSIDAFIAYVPDANIIFKSLGLKPYPHDKANPMAVHPDAMVCKNVDPQFIKTFNDGIKSLSQSGRLKAILGDGYVEP
ncbi:MAG: transporter substrate-binding domain-containing protein [Bermanella sp.]